jgi:hypothetical protein
MYAYDHEQQMINGTTDDFCETDSVPSNLLKNKQPRSKGNRCYTVERVINKKWHDGKFYKTVKINMYGSGDYGSYIRNAVTGIYTNVRVGSKSELLYYGVVDCTGLDKINGPVHLYYDTPSQYEAHQFVTVDASVKDDWLRRVNLLSN